MYPGNYMDVSFIVDETNPPVEMLVTLYKNGVPIDSIYDTFTYTNNEGVFRLPIYQRQDEDAQTLRLSDFVGDQVSEIKTVNIVSDCANQELNICWLNYLGGFDWHVFTTRKTYSIETSGTKTQRKNIFNNWPTSYGPDADTIDRVTKRDSKNVLDITSQYVTIDQEDAIKYIMTSPLVQIVNGVGDRRTVLVKNSTLPIRRDQDKLRKLSFTLEYTDEIPSQSL